MLDIKLIREQPDFVKGERAKAGVEKQEIDRIIEAELHRPFDLAHGPLVRAGLWRLSGAEHLLIFALHHIVVDGKAIEIISDELADLYAACARPARSALAKFQAARRRAVAFFQGGAPPPKKTDAGARLAGGC